ncbi:uncharacterized protein VTP21DRAFT_1541 [Calcarisporiella thermophila]|uniref:uncharacterized protein n=1 Tax=Calcarisporiella thermophila TaxID=911321 RepID=UPI00374334E4
MTSSASSTDLSPQQQQAEVWLPFQVGEVIEDMDFKYSLHLLAPLGQGSYAMVYKARDKTSGQIYTIKCLSTAALTEEQLRIQLNEVVIHKMLPKHPRLVSFHDYFGRDQWLFLLLEYCNGRDLYWFITQNQDHYDQATGRRLSERERYALVAKIFDQCLDSVAVIHERKVAHRDLKPENFLIDGQNNVLLTDFGLATSEEICIDFDCGSRPYMSYECRNPDAGDAYDPFQADIWSLGVILINLLWHRSPWADPHPESCASYAAFQRLGADYLLSQFEGMPVRMARFLSKRVFCPVGGEMKRIRLGEWKRWCEDLVEMMMDPLKELEDDEWVMEFSPTLEKSAEKERRKGLFGLGALTLTLSGRRTHHKAGSPRAKREKTPQPMTPPKTPVPSIRGHHPSWSDDIDSSPQATGKMDFSKPIIFEDEAGLGNKLGASSPLAQDKGHRDENRVQTSALRSDDDSGFATDEGEKRGGDENSQEQPAKAVQEATLKPELLVVPKNARPPRPHYGRRMKFWKRSSLNNVKDKGKQFNEATVSSPPSSQRQRLSSHHRPQRLPRHRQWSTLEHQDVTGNCVVGVGAYAYEKRPFAPPPPTWRNWCSWWQPQSPTSSASFYGNSDQSFSTAAVANGSAQTSRSRRRASCVMNSSTTQPQPKKPQHRRHASCTNSALNPSNYTYPNQHRRRRSTASSSASISVFNGPMMGMSGIGAGCGLVTGITLGGGGTANDGGNERDLNTHGATNKRLSTPSTSLRETGNYAVEEPGNEWKKVGGTANTRARRRYSVRSWTPCDRWGNVCSTPTVAEEYAGSGRRALAKECGLAPLEKPLNEQYHLARQPLHTAFDSSNASKINETTTTESSKPPKMINRSALQQLGHMLRSIVNTRQGKTGP